MYAPQGIYLPSTTRWYTFSPHLACQGAGVFIHQFLPRLLKRVLVTGPLEEDADNFHVVAHKKKTQALAFMAPDVGTSLFFVGRVNVFLRWFLRFKSRSAFRSNQFRHGPTMDHGI